MGDFCPYEANCMLWSLTSINRDYSPNTIALLGCIWSRRNMSCCLLAPEGSAFFRSSCFAAPRLLPCCPQLAEVKPCPKYPCTPSESNLGFIAAISFTCAVWGQDRKSRNCLSLAEVSKCLSQPGTRGTNFRAVSLHPWWKKPSREPRAEWLDNPHHYRPCCSKNSVPLLRCSYLNNF